MIKLLERMVVAFEVNARGWAEHIVEMKRHWAVLEGHWAKDEAIKQEVKRNQADQAVRSGLIEAELLALREAIAALKVERAKVDAKGEVQQ